MKKIFNENPLLIYGMGVCIGLISSVNLDFALYTGILVLITLILGSIILSLIKKITPLNARFKTSLLMTTLIVSILSMICNAYITTAYNIYSSIIHLIIVNSVIVYNFEKIYENKFIDNLINSVFYGVSYLISIVLIAIFRQVISTGILSLTSPFDSNLLFNINIIPSEYVITLFKSNVGAFFVLGIFMALFSKFKKGENK